MKTFYGYLYVFYCNSYDLIRTPQYSLLYSYNIRRERIKSQTKSNINYFEDRMSRTKTYRFEDYKKISTENKTINCRPRSLKKQFFKMPRWVRGLVKTNKDHTSDTERKVCIMLLQNNVFVGLVNYFMNCNGLCIYHKRLIVIRVWPREILLKM